MNSIPGLSGTLMSGISPGIGSGGVGGIGGNSGGMMMPNQTASHADGATFGDTLKSFIIDGPSAQQATADSLSAQMAAGKNVDPHKLAIETAKAGIEIQMSTRTISQAVSAIRTLFQMQI